MLRKGYDMSDLIQSGWMKPLFHSSEAFSFSFFNEFYSLAAFASLCLMLISIRLCNIRFFSNADSQVQTTFSYLHVLLRPLRHLVQVPFLYNRFTVQNIVIRPLCYNESARKSAVIEKAALEAQLTKLYRPHFTNQLFLSSLLLHL